MRMKSRTHRSPIVKVLASAKSNQARPSDIHDVGTNKLKHETNSLFLAPQGRLDTAINDRRHRSPKSDDGFGRPRFVQSSIGLADFYFPHAGRLRPF